MRAWRPQQDAKTTDRVPGGMQTAAAWTWRVLVLLVGLGVLGYVLGYLAEVIVPLGIALLLAAVLAPAVRRLAAWGVPRSLAVALVMIAGLAVVAGVFSGVISAFVAGLPQLQAQVGQSLAAINHWLAAGPLHLQPHALQNLFHQAITALNQNRAQLASGALTTALTAGKVLTGIALTIFVLIFFLRDGDPIWRFVIRIVPGEVRPRVDAAGRAGFSTLTHYVRATVLVAAGDAIGIGVGLLIVGVPLALPLSTLVFLGAFIPIVGSVLAGTVAVLVALVANGFVPALIVLGIVLAVMQFEGNVAQPLLMGHAVRLHPLAIVLAITVGAVIAGIPGALLAVPVLAVLNTAIRVLIHYPQPWPPPGSSRQRPRWLTRRPARLSATRRAGIRKPEADRDTRQGSDRPGGGG